MMTNNQKELPLLKKLETLVEFGEKNIEIDDYITNNINQKFKLRKYQKKAFKNYLVYLNNDNIRENPSHLMFNMATGSGKTLMMALVILDLYKRGYRNFIFFVNSKTIIDKTKENFLNENSNKYLFSDKIWIDDKEVNIRHINNIEESDKKNINIIFTTIQQLHTDLNEAKENSITYNDFKNRKIVLISDEAHHINALTKSKSKMTKKDKKNMNTWEATINNIFSAYSENILLEYTATINLGDENVYEKYKNKIIYKYDLKNYREDGFSKDISLLRTDEPKKTRLLQGLISSQFRKKLAENNSIFLKPIILFKSYKIAESKKHKKFFHKLINNLTVSDLENIKQLKNKPQIIKDAFNYFEDNDITLDSLVKEFKLEFDKTKCIKVDSKSDLEDEQVLLNSLEDKNNEIRGIFAVNKLNEGWDVLNLFDIVRLGEIKKTKKKTNQEAQLIGRGARYCPFILKDEKNKFKRKFDQEPKNNLRYLEKLYYHSINKNKFIVGLKTKLKDSGIYIDEDDKKEIKLELKEDFKKSKFYKKGKIYLNKKQKRNKKKINKLEDLYNKKRYKFELGGDSNYESQVFGSKNNKTENTKIKNYKFSKFNINLIRTAINKIPFYNFNNLKKYLVNLNSISEFIISDNYLNSIIIEIDGSEKKLNELSKEKKLKILIKILKDIKKDIKNNLYEYKGTTEFKQHEIKKIIKNTKRILLKDSSKAVEVDSLNVESEGWYPFKKAYGTSQERDLIKMIYSNINKLKEKFDTIKLVRNEGFFPIYNFKDGRRFEPDFVLFLKKTNDVNSIWYQAFIEPKGEFLKGKENDKWKEEFLKKIEEKCILKTDNYNLYGLPFYNSSSDSKLRKFEEAFFEKIDIEYK